MIGVTPEPPLRNSSGAGAPAGSTNAPAAGPSAMASPMRTRSCSQLETRPPASRLTVMATRRSPGADEIE